MELTQQKCASCSKYSSAMSSEEASKMLEQVPGWEITDGKIERSLKFPDFVSTMRFANRITKLAEEENHHPDLHISYGKMRIELSTHSVKGLSQNDFIMAAKINELVDKEEEGEVQAI